jgi:hypothetical protein
LYQTPGLTIIFIDDGHLAAQGLENEIACVDIKPNADAYHGLGRSIQMAGA